MNTAPRTIRASVGPKVLSHAAEFFNQSPSTILSELVQNSRRAHATHVAITTSPNRDGSMRVRFADDGDGISDPETLLRFGASAWDESTEIKERPAGMGFFSLASRGVRVESNTWAATITPAGFQGAEDITIEDHAQTRGTALLFEITQAEQQSLEAERLGFSDLVRSVGAYAPIAISINGKTIERGDYLRTADSILETSGVRIGLYDESRYSSNSHAPQINFFGHLLGARLPIVAFRNVKDEHHLLTAKLDVVNSSALHLVLPTRDKVVEDPSFAELRRAIRVEMYRYLLAQKDVTYAFSVYQDAHEHGVELPIPKRAPISSWSTSDEDDNIYLPSDYGETETFYLDLADTGNRTRYAFCPFTDTRFARALGQGLQTYHAEHGTFPMLDEDSDYKGYPGYDCIEEASIALRLSTGGEHFIVSAEKIGELDDCDDLAPLLGAESAAKVQRVKSLYCVDDLAFLITTAAGQTVLPVHAIALETYQWNTPLAIVTTKTPINDLAFDLAEQMWCASDDDDSDAYELFRKDVAQNLRDALLTSREAHSLAIRDIISEHLHTIAPFDGPSRVEIIIKRDQNNRNLTITFSND